MKPSIIKGAAGCGKTEKVLRIIADSDEGPWEYYAPTHKLAEECAARLRKMNPYLRVKVIKGRDHCSEGNVPMCKKHKQAGDLIKAGQSVFPLLCLQSAGKSNPSIKCEHYDQCPYIQQFVAADVYFYPHAYLTLERSILERRAPIGFVVDESCVLGSVESVNFQISRLTDACIPDAAVDVCAELSNAIKNSPGTIRDVVSNAMRSGKWESARKALRRVAAGIKPDTPAEQFNALVKKAQNFKHINVLIDNLQRSVNCRHPPQSIEFDGKCTVWIHHRKDILRRFDMSCLDGTTLCTPRMFLLDASASEVLMERFFPESTFVEIPIARNAYVIQNKSGRCANNSMVLYKESSRPNAKKATAASKTAAKRHLKDIQLLLNRLSEEGRKVLVVGPSSVVGNPGKNIKPLLKCPKGTEFAHFNALRGVDKWKDCDTVVVIGRNQPPIIEAERIAKGMFFDHPMPLKLTGRWEEEKRGYKYRYGKKGVDVQVHLDARVQAIVEQIRENESLQALDRSRLIHNEKIKTVILLSNLPLDIDVDELLTWGEIIHGGNRLERAWAAQTDGALPLNAKWLASTFPELWPTEAAAKKDVARKRGQTPNINIIRKMSPFEFDYKPSRQRTWSRCLSRFSDPEVVAEALTNTLGAPVSVKPAQSVAEVRKAA